MVATKKRGLEVDLSIDRLTSEGFGIGSVSFDESSSSEITVPFTVPKDQVTAKIKRKKRGVFEASLEKVLSPSPNRIPPKCIHFGSCGGCLFQMLPYEEQLRIKQERILDTFKTEIKESTLVYPIIGCQTPYYYRNKMEFSFSEDKKGEKFLGLVLQGSKGKVFSLEECHLCSSWIPETVKEIKSWWDQSSLTAFNPFSGLGSLRSLTMREGVRTEDKMVILTCSGNPEFALKKRELDSFVNTVRNKLEGVSSKGKLSIFLRIHQAIKGMPTNFYEMHLFGSDTIQEKLYLPTEDPEKPEELLFTISPQAFFQPNTTQAEKLYARALELASIQKEEIVYDLFCGTGTLGICCAKKAKQVIGIELSSEAALDARANVAQNGLSNVHILFGAVRHTLKQIYEEKRFPMPDVALIDPPRPGLDPEALKALLDVQPERIVYIACNPKTQAENVKVLIEAGYSLQALQAVDQFPQTNHVENIALLVRS